MTIYEMAEKAGVSIATISRAVNPETRSKVSPDTLEKIDRLIVRFGYAPNAAAKNLMQTRFKTIGILMPHHAGIFLEDYYTQILAGVSDALVDSDYHFKIVMLKCRDEKWDKYNFKFSQGIDGLVITHWHAFFSRYSIFEKINIPCTVISDPEPKMRVHFVSGDHFQGGALAAEYLYSRGHRQFAVLTGPQNSVDSTLRVRGFQSFLAGKGIALQPELIRCGEFQEEKGYEAAGELVCHKDRFTALFCCNDNMALGALRKFSEHGISCPDEISVMGYDDDKRAAASHPPLTSVRVPIYELAKKAADHLIHYLKEKNKKDFFYRETLLPVCLVERKSVKKLQ